MRNRQFYNFIGIGTLVGISLGATMGYAISAADAPAEVDIGDEEIVEIIARDYAFEPNRIVIDDSAPKTIRVRSADEQHTFTVDELNIDVEVPAGEIVLVDLTDRAQGTYTFYCAVPGHREQGMEGSLVVNHPMGDMDSAPQTAGVVSVSGNEQ